MCVDMSYTYSENCNKYSSFLKLPPLQRNPIITAYGASCVSSNQIFYILAIVLAAIIKS